MSKSESFLNEYKVAPNPMSGVAGRMKNMARQAGAGGGSTAALQSTAAAAQGEAQANETMHEQSRNLTMLNAKLSADQLSSQEAIAQARIDAENHTSTLEKISYYGGIAQAAHGLVASGVKALREDGTVTENDDGTFEYQQGDVRGGVAGKALQKLQGVLEVIPANKAARVKMESAKAEGAILGHMLKERASGLPEETREFMDTLGRMELGFQGIAAAADSLAGLSDDLDGVIQETLANVDRIRTETTKVHDVTGALEAYQGVVEQVQGPPAPSTPGGTPLPDGTQGPPSPEGAKPAQKMRNGRPDLSNKRSEWGERVSEENLRGMIDVAIGNLHAENVDTNMAYAVAEAESSRYPEIMSHRGAKGLMQLMPSTAEWLGVNRDDPQENVQGGVKYLDYLFGKYGNWEHALVAYNWGPGNADKWLRRTSGDMNRIPKNTKAYIAKIMENYRGMQAREAAEPGNYEPRPSPPPLHRGNVMGDPNTLSGF